MTDPSELAFYSCDYAREFADDEISGCCPTAGGRREYGRPGAARPGPRERSEGGNRGGRLEASKRRRPEGAQRPESAAVRVTLDARPDRASSGVSERPRDRSRRERDGGTLTRNLIEEYKNE